MLSNFLFLAQKYWINKYREYMPAKMGVRMGSPRDVANVHEMYPDSSCEMSTSYSLFKNSKTFLCGLCQKYETISKSHLGMGGGKPPVVSDIMLACSKFCSCSFIFVKIDGSAKPQWYQVKFHYSVYKGSVVWEKPPSPEKLSNSYRKICVYSYDL